MEQMLPSSGHVFALVEEYGQLRPEMFVVHARVRFEHGPKPVVGGPSNMRERDESLEVPANLALVPRCEDCLDTREVLVQRRATDARTVCDFGHRDRSQAALFHERRRGLENRVAHGAAMAIDGLIPELRHVRRF